MRLFSYGLAEMCEARIPARFWIDDGAQEHRGELIGIGPRHFIMTSPVAMEDGMRLAVKLALVTEPLTGESAEIEVFGWVVSGSILADGHFGCQVELERD
jgi:hypothetical protein